MSKNVIATPTDAIVKYGDLCRTHSCDACPIASKLNSEGSEYTCQELMVSFPQKVIQVLEEFCGEPNTYEKEFRRRFPYNKARLDEFAGGLCRKVVFEGNTEAVDSCNGDCVACWSEPYVDDYEDADAYESRYAEEE